MTESMVLVLGTHNQKKRLELEQLLGPHGFLLETLAGCDNPLEVEETGSSFAENAGLKASEQAKHLGQWVLGEDSGLSVISLDHAPGIYSARYSGPEATDQSNNDYLLEQLADRPRQQRTAYYTCHMALSDPAGNIRASTEATCHGWIRTQPAGSNGFGYDPLFEIAEFHRTFGELGSTVKAVLSHRSRATRRLVPQLRALRAGWHDQLEELRS